MIEFKHLDWDSSFFGFPVASVLFTEELNIDKVISVLDEKGYRLIYLFVPEKYKHLENTFVKQYGGILADRKITYRRDLPEIQNYSPAENIRINEYSIVNEDLIKLALIAGSFSRFKTDTNFREEYFINLYREWIVNSIAGKMADYVVTYRSSNHPEGLVTLSIDGELGRIGLISVSADVQSKGVGSQLINEVFAICLKHGARFIEVVTQEDNYKACRFYIKNGFVKNRMEYVYHFWLKK